MKVKAKFVQSRLNRLLQAWETKSPEATFAGMTIGQFREAVQPSVGHRERLVELRSQLAQTVGARATADENTSELIKRVIGAIVATEGSNGSMLRDIGLKAARERQSGLTRRKGDGESPVTLPLRAA